MSGPFQYVLSDNFFAYTPSSVSAVAGFPVTLLQDWASPHPIARPWKSVAITGDLIIFDFGSIQSGTWVAVFGANFANIQIGIGDGATYVDVVTGGALVTRTIPEDSEDPEGYRKLFLPAVYSGRYGRIDIPSQATTDGSDNHKIGLVLWGNSLVTMSRHFQVPFTEDYREPKYTIEGKDWEEHYPAGIRSKLLTIRNNVPNAEAEEWHALRRLSPGSRFLGHLNLDDPSQVYIYERNQPVTITRNGKHTEINTGFGTVA